MPKAESTCATRVIRVSAATAAAAVCTALLLADSSGRGAAPQNPAQLPAIVLTFDDLPYVDARRSGDLPHARTATVGILRALKAHGAPAAGFVNEGKLRGSDARIALLTAWIEAGHTLGNHTFSHADLNTVTVEQYRTEIVRGEAVTRRLLGSRAPYQLYFRHPYTHTGETAEKKVAIERFLEARGYRIAPHTIDSADYIFNAVYVRALDADDKKTAARLRSAYVEFVLEATAFAERMAPQIFGRAIPQVILLHANDINAGALEELLVRLEGRGYRFITLDEAFSDAAYATPDTFVTRFGPTWLWRWSRSLGLSIGFKGDPEPPAWVMEAYEAARGGRE